MKAHAVEALRRAVAPPAEASFSSGKESIPLKDPEVSIIIISYNTREMTLEAIRSAQAETQASQETIVIDNASSDGSAEAIAERFPEIRLIAEQKNHGFAQANNLAARIARGRYLLLLNPDTVVLDGAIDKLLTFAQTRPEAKIWGGRTVFADGSLNPGSCWGAMNTWALMCQAVGLSSVFRESGLFNREGYGGWRRDSERPVDIVSGCFLLIERSFWERLGGFDRLFVMYGEEADLCLRARDLGAQPWITPDACIIHHGGASDKVRAEKMIRLLRAKTSLIQRHFPSRTRDIGLALFRAWPWSRMAAHRLLAGVSGSEEKKSNHAVWREIWRRRQEWWRGYPE